MRQNIIFRHNATEGSTDTMQLVKNFFLLFKSWRFLDTLNRKILYLTNTLSRDAIAFTNRLQSLSAWFVTQTKAAGNNVPGSFGKNKQEVSINLFRLKRKRHDNNV